VGNIVTMPASAAIPAGQTTVTVPISVVGNPGAGTTLTFNVSATVPMLTGGSLLANGTFTVTGVAPPPVPVLGNPLGGPGSPIAS
jgi:multidrug efflux pump subunit AcrA (membrane-fusion protein)